MMQGSERRSAEVSSIGDLMARGPYVRHCTRRQPARASEPSEAPSPILSVDEAERRFEETNILQIEGRLFCFDPREARRRSGKISFGDAGSEHRVTIDLHPSYGQPSVLAYRILQAIFKKLADDGFPASDTVSFSQRELARLAGRQSFGGKQSQELFRALSSSTARASALRSWRKLADGEMRRDGGVWISW